MKQRLIRFDVRLDRDDYVGAFWDREHRSRFLLKPDLEWPLSVDPLVWPSVFYSEIFREATKLPYGSIEVPPSTDDGQYWLNFERMKNYYQAHKGQRTSGVFVGIGLFSEKTLTEDIIPYETGASMQCALTLGRTVPSEIPPASELLGYDVADGSWISGLSNCEYSPQERERLRRLWASRMNEFGLLTSLEDAVQFRLLSDARVPEHSPFWVYGIWRLQVPD
jgi:hypothetical protein